MTLSRMSPPKGFAIRTVERVTVRETGAKVTGAEVRVRSLPSCKPAFSFFGLRRWMMHPRTSVGVSLLFALLPRFGIYKHTYTVSVLIHTASVTGRAAYSRADTLDRRRQRDQEWPTSRLRPDSASCLRASSPRRAKPTSSRSCCRLPSRVPTRTRSRTPRRTAARGTEVSLFSFTAYPSSLVDIRTAA